MESRSPTFLIPLHIDSVGFEEALVGERGFGPSQHRILVQTHRRRRSFGTWDVDRNLEGTESAGSGLHIPTVSPMEVGRFLTLLG